MFAPKPRLYVAPRMGGGVSAPQFPFERNMMRDPDELNEQGNPNVIPGEMPLDDPTFGLSREDVYPGKHSRSLWTRFQNRWIT